MTSAAPAQPRTLETLMEAYQQSDEQAFTELVAAVTPKLRNFFLGPQVTRRHTDDLLQECWMRVHRARHTYQAGRPVLPWVFAIARYTRTDEYRRMSRAEPQHEIDGELAPDPKSQAAAAEARSDFRTLIETLPPRQRQVVLLLKMHGFSLEEAARKTDSTVSATKQAAHRAYAKLRQTARLPERTRSHHHRTN